MEMLDFAVPEITHCLRLAVTPENPPTTIQEAFSQPDGDLWKAAADKEFASLTKMKTWTLTELPAGRKAITSKWVFRIKRNANGSIDKYKCRVVARGFNQTYGVDFTETFAPVVRSSSLRSMLAYAVQRKMKIDQMDVETAYLNGSISEEIYMRQPDGYAEPGKEHLVCRLHKSLYGLKQSGRCWNQKLVEFLKSKGFIQLKSDSSIFFCPDPFIIITVYVDDLVLMTDTDEEMRNLKAVLSSGFKMVDQGPIHHLLGIQFERTENSLRMNQELYVSKMLERFRMNDAHPVTTPSDPNVVLQKEDGSKPVDQTYYQSIIGSLLFLALTTRPDIQLAVGKCARYNSNPLTSHLTAARRILRYLKGTPALGLFFSSEKTDLIGYSDADFAGDYDDRKSTSGYIFMFGGGPISWYSGKQKSTSVSTAGAEYIALGSCVREGMYLQQLFAEIGTQFSPLVIMEDNQAALAMAKNPVYHSKQKHIDVQWHFIRDESEKGTITLKYCPTKEMVADVLTKPIPRPAFVKMIQFMGLQ
jgi:hypothetical protein